MSLSPPKFSPYSSPLFAKNKNKFALYDENGIQLNNFSTSTSPTKNNENFEIDSIRRNTVHGIATSKSVILSAENAENLDNDGITKRDKKFSGDISSAFVSLDDNNGKIDIGRNRNDNDKIDNFKNRGKSNQILTPKRRKIYTDKNEDFNKIKDIDNEGFIDNYDIYNNNNNNDNNNYNNNKNYDINVNKNLNNDKKNNDNSNNYDINAGIKQGKDDGIHNRNRVRSSAKKAMSKKDLILLNKSRSGSKSEMNNKHDVIDGNNNSNSNDSSGNNDLMTMDIEGYSTKLKDAMTDDHSQGGEGQREGRRGKEGGQREVEGGDDDNDDDDVSSNYSDPKEYQQWRSVHSDLEYEGKSGDDYEVEEDEEEEEDEYEVDFRNKGKALRDSSKILIPHLSYSSFALSSQLSEFHPKLKVF